MRKSSMSSSKSSMRSADRAGTSALSRDNASVSTKPTRELVTSSHARAARKSAGRSNSPRSGTGCCTACAGCESQHPVKQVDASHNWQIETRRLTSHSDFGGLSFLSALTASRWQLAWIRLKCVTVVIAVSSSLHRAGQLLERCKARTHSGENSLPIATSLLKT